MSKKTQTEQKQNPNSTPKLTGIISRGASGIVNGHKSITELMRANEEAIANR